MLKRLAIAAMLAAAVTAGAAHYSIPLTAGRMTVTGGKIMFASESTLGVGLYAHWKLNDSNATVIVTDATGTNTLNASANTATLSTNGVIGGALRFATDRVVTGTKAGFPTTGITISVWAKLGGDGELSGWFFMKGGNAAGEMSFSRRGGSQDYLNMDGNFGAGWGGNQSTAKDPSTVGVWTHYVATWDGANIRMFANTVQVGNAIAKTGTIASTHSTIWLGDEGAWNSQNYIGWLDDVRVYNRALSTNEIAELYNAGAGTEYPP
jgi:hypothetical protein